MTNENEKKMSFSEVWKIFEKKTDKEKIIILSRLVDIVQGYNGQSKTRAMASAMGIEYDE